MHSSIRRSHIRTDEEYDIAEAIIETLAELEFSREDEADEKRSCLRVQRVLDQLGCTNRIFWELDEFPGRHGYERNGQEWHYKLRTWRNSARKYDYMDGFQRVTSIAR